MWRGPPRRYPDWNMADILICRSPKRTVVSRGFLEIDEGVGLCPATSEAYAGGTHGSKTGHGQRQAKRRRTAVVTAILVDPRALDRVNSVLS